MIWSEGALVAFTLHKIFLGRTRVARNIWVARWSDQKSFGSHYGRTISWDALRSDQWAVGRTMIW